MRYISPKVSLDDVSSTSLTCGIPLGSNVMWMSISWSDPFIERNTIEASFAISSTQISASCN